MKKYNIRQANFSITNNYKVFNESNKIIFTITSTGVLAFIDKLIGSICSIGYTLYLKNLNNENVLSIKKEKSLIFEKFKIFKNGDLISSIERDKKLTTPSITIKADSNIYTIKADIFAKNFSIIKDNKIYANVKKVKFSLKDSYELSIIENSSNKDTELLISFVIIIDNCFYN